MLVVDASCLCEVVIGGPAPRRSANGCWLIRTRPRPTSSTSRSSASSGASICGDGWTAPRPPRPLKTWTTWPGERFGHRPLLARAWELRDTVRGWDAMYVALAEALDAVLVTTDDRLAATTGPTCTIERVGPR